MYIYMSSLSFHCCGCWRTGWHISCNERRGTVAGLLVPRVQTIELNTCIAFNDVSVDVKPVFPHNSLVRSGACTRAQCNFNFSARLASPPTSPTPQPDNPSFSCCRDDTQRGSQLSRCCWLRRAGSADGAGCAHQLQRCFLFRRYSTPVGTHQH